MTSALSVIEPATEAVLEARNTGKPISDARSGHGRELGPHALDACTEVKSIYSATGM